MRGDDQEPDGMFSYVSTEAWIPVDHPLRAMRDLMDAAGGNAADISGSRSGGPNGIRTRV